MGLSHVTNTSRGIAPRFRRARVPVLASLVLTLSLAAGCAPPADGASASTAAAPGGDDGDGRQALLTINHLAPRPDSVGRQPDRFQWTPIAGADSYALGLVSEIDTVVWQTSGIPKPEVDWPAGLDVAEGTYFWMVEGYQGTRRIAESGRAAFVVER